MVSELGKLILGPEFSEMLQLLWEVGIFNFDHDILVDFDVKFEIFAMSDFWFGKLFYSNS